jgi:hypothetical protein
MDQGKGTVVKQGFPKSYVIGAMITLVLLTCLALLSTGALVRPGHYEAEFMPRTTGKAVWQLGASWGRVVCGEPGQQGELVYGPYEWIDPKAYSVEFVTSIQAEPGITVGRVEVSDAKTGAILAQQEITSRIPGQERRLVTLTYSLTQTSLLEFRVWYYGTQRLCVDDILNRTNTSQPNGKPGSDQ